MTIHLTRKNSLTVVQVVCMVALATIPLIAEPSHLGWLRWIIPMWSIVIVGVFSAILQAALQSKEDHEREERERQREEREQKRDENQEKITAALSQLTQP